MRLGPSFAIPPANVVTRDTRATPHRGQAIGTDDASVLIMRGCVQCVVTPEVNDHLAGLLAGAVSLFSFPTRRFFVGHGIACGRHRVALNQMQRNVRAVNPSVVKTVISTATGCGVTLKEYGRLSVRKRSSVFCQGCDAAEYLQSHTFTKQREDVTRVAWQHHALCSMVSGFGALLSRSLRKRLRVGAGGGCTSLLWFGGGVLHRTTGTSREYGSEKSIR
ncbi:MAG: hypothetical protein Ct9H300mP8_12900 [Gammaproteobacteria bacterium]|nr:MAG: hypothetical protein Ct9H300mP8_12900 [Gammaproteobacteria bacterium]